MTRRLAGLGRRRPAHEQQQQDDAQVLAADPRRICELEHDTGFVEVGAHGIDDPCPRCLGHRPGDEAKRVRRQRAYEAAMLSGREFRAINAMGDLLPVRILYLDGQPAPDLDDDERTTE